MYGDLIQLCEIETGIQTNDTPFILVPDDNTIGQTGDIESYLPHISYFPTVTQLKQITTRTVVIDDIKYTQAIDFTIPSNQPGLLRICDKLPLATWGAI